ncbi:MAG: sigma-70 family RNA polymerase sigma factor [Chloroflexota bacterium]
MEDALAGSAFITASDEESCDAHLVEAAKKNPEAFGELYELYHARIYRYVYHRVGGQADAEDITALVFTKALEALPSYYAKRNSFAPWLFRIARNSVVDHYRRHKNERSLEDLDKEADNTDPLRHALGNESREELASLVTYLSTEQKDVVLMRFAGDLAFSEIAAAMKKSEPAIRMLLYRALRRLRTVLDDEHL